MAEPGTSDTGLLEELGSEDRATQRAACNAIAERLPQEPAMRDALHRVLLDGSPRARFGAAWTLFQVERPTLRVLPALLDALELEDGDVRWSAAHMLSTLGRMQSEVFPVLLDTAKRSSSPVRRRMALYALRELAPDRDETRDALLEALADRALDVRRAALSSLAKLQEPDRATFERVLDVLRDDRDPRMRRIAATLVPDLCAALPDAAPMGRAALERAAHAEDDPLVRSASLALSRLG